MRVPKVYPIDSRSVKEGPALIDLDFRESGLTLKVSSTRIADILEEVGKIVMDPGRSDILVRVRGNRVLEEEDINQLNGDAYKLIV